MMTSIPTRILADNMVPWVPLSDRKSFKPLRFFENDRGFVELLRLEPGEASPLHRHTGDVHAFNLHGSRELCTGELIEPGDYVYEPAGNVDSWKAVGDTALVVLVIVTGEVEFLGPDKRVISCVTGKTLMDAYERYCLANNMQPLDLVESEINVRRTFKGLHL